MVRRQSSGCGIFARFYHCAVIAYRQFHAVAIHKVGRLRCNRLLRVAVIFERGFAVKRKRKFALFNRQRCRLVCNEFIVLAIACERCRYFIFASVNFVIARVLCGHSVGQVRCFNRVRLPVVGHSFIRKDNCTHIIGRLVDSERCRKFNGVVVCKGNGCFNGVFTCICIARCLIVRHLRARRQTCNGKRFCRSVVGRCHVVKDQPCEVVIFERYRPRAGHAFIAHRQSVRADGGKLGVIFRRQVVGGQCCRFRGIVAIRYRDGVVRIVKFVDKDFRFTRNADTFQRGRRGRFFLTASRKECREQTQAKPK